MLAEFDLSNLGPLLPIAFVVFGIISLLLKGGKKALRDSWEGETWQPPHSPGDRPNADNEPIVLGRLERRPAMPVPPPLPTASRPPSHWEAELERVLRGDTARPAAPPLPPAPPAPPPSRSWSGSFDYDQDSEIESAPAPSAPLATLRESAEHRQHADEAYAAGASLQEQIAQRMRQVDARVKSHNTALVSPSARNAGPASESAAVRTWLKQPDTARAAMVAAIVFGPPKALET